MQERPPVRACRCAMIASLLQMDDAFPDCQHAPAAAVYVVVLCMKQKEEFGRGSVAQSEAGHKVRSQHWNMVYVLVAANATAVCTTFASYTGGCG